MRSKGAQQNIAIIQPPAALFCLEKRVCAVYTTGNKETLSRVHAMCVPMLEINALAAVGDVKN